MIGLCIIVKNESEVIERCLRSSLQYMDTYCIVDTGSTDNTIEIIKRVAQDMNIRGVVYERTWVNFGYNRTECLQLAREFINLDWMFMMDADDSIDMISNKNFLQNLDIDEVGYYVNIEYNSIKMKRVHLFNTKYNWVYRGALHEYPFCETISMNKLKLVNSIKIIARTEGARSKDPNKYINDALLLQNELCLLRDNKLKNISCDIDESRTLFYLAQSYRDSGNLVLASKYYKERIDIGGWVEEVYVSYCNLIDITTSFDEKLQYCWKAQNIIVDSIRKEAVYRILTHCRKCNIFTQEIFALGMAYRHIVLKDDNLHLFTEIKAYGWSYDDELSIVAYYTSHYDISRNICIVLLSICPESEKERIQKNLDFAIKNILI
jgi:glycosyltransferase involved in cell wall biosynthesis